MDTPAAIPISMNMIGKLTAVAPKSICTHDVSHPDHIDNAVAALEHIAHEHRERKVYQVFRNAAYGQILAELLIFHINRQKL